MTFKYLQVTLIILFIFNTNFLFSQQFKTNFIAESNGLIDSVVIGYDPTASIQIDSQFGEYDINYTEYDSTFEIRVGQIDINYFECGANIVDNNNPFLTYMSKTDILPKECLGWDSNQTSNGLIPYSTLLVRNKDMPITLSWNSSVFQDSCIESSVISDWHPSFWYDVSCGQVNISPMSLKENSSIILSEETEMYLVDNWGDTISMFYIVLQNKDEISNITEFSTFTTTIYPNPTSNFVTIKSEQSEINLVEIYNSYGQLIMVVNKPKIVDLQDEPDGIYFFKMIARNSSVIKEVVLQKN